LYLSRLIGVFRSNSRWGLGGFASCVMSSSVLIPGEPLRPGDEPSSSKSSEGGAMLRTSPGMSRS
jgi:hypothetical protein